MADVARRSRIAGWLAGLFAFALSGGAIAAPVPAILTAANNADLGALSTKDAPNGLQRCGYLIPGDSPCLPMQPSSAACGISEFVGTVTTAQVPTNQLNVTSVTSGTLRPGLVMPAGIFTAGTIISSQLSGTPGGVGVYQLSQGARPPASFTLTVPGDGAAQVPSADGGCWLGQFSQSGTDVKTWGAVCDGTSDDSASFVAADAASGYSYLTIAATCRLSNNVTIGHSVVFAPLGAVSVDTGKTLTLNGHAVVNLALMPYLGAGTVIADQFSGTFGATVLSLNSPASGNTLLGQTINNQAPGSTILPVATVGACQVTTQTVNNGNTCFGLYGLGELRSGTGGAGVSVGEEVTTRNFTGAPASTSLPPNTAFGTSTPVANGLHVTCGTLPGTSNCSIGVYVTNEASDFSKGVFNTGEYLALYNQYGVYVDAPPSGNQTAAVLANNGNGTNLQLTTTGNLTAANSTITQFDKNNVLRYNVKQNGDVYVNTTQYVGHNAGPSLGACGTGSPTLGAFSTDAKGTVSVGAGTTSCVVNFGTAFTQTPVIVVTGENVTSLNVQAKSATSFTVGGASLAGTTFDYIVASNGSL